MSIRHTSLRDGVRQGRFGKCHLICGVFLTFLKKNHTFNLHIYSHSSPLHIMSLPTVYYKMPHLTFPYGDSHLISCYWEYLSPLLVKSHTYLPFHTVCFIFSLHKQSLTSYSKEPYANFLHLSVNHHFILRVMSHLFILRVNFHLSISRIIHHFSRLRTIPNLFMLRILPHLTISKGNPLSPNNK